MILVNLFGVPGAGKTTGAMYITSMLKMNGVNAEYVSEFAKDKVYEENKEVFNNQAYIFGKQYFKITRVQNKVDVVVTDSPLLLSIFYNNDELLKKSGFNSMVSSIFDSYNTMDYLIHRVKEYNPNGRFQTEKESDALLPKMEDCLRQYGVDYVNKGGNIKDYDSIGREVFEAFKAQKEEIKV